MNEDTIRDIYYVEHKWNPHFFYLSPKSFCQDLEKNGSDLYLDLFHAMYQEESDYICPYTENDFSLRKELCNNGTTIIYQLITPSPVLSPLTRCVYFCCQLDKQQYFYYTSENTIFHHSRKSPFLRMLPNSVSCLFCKLSRKDKIDSLNTGGGKNRKSRGVLTTLWQNMAKNFSVRCILLQRSGKFRHVRGDAIFTT